MEEKITQHTNTIRITILATGADKGLAADLSSFIAPDGKEARDFVFEIEDIAAASAEKYSDSHLVILATDSGEDKTEEHLARTLSSKGIRNITLDSTATELTSKSRQLVEGLEKALDSGFTIDDYVDIYNMGIPMEAIRRQLIVFRNGIAKVILEKPAVINDGIYPLSRQAAEHYAALFDSRKDDFSLLKFVPASGAASRMFKFLSEFMTEFNPDVESMNAYINRKKDNALSVFLVGIDKFPFFKEILQVTRQNPEYAEWNKNMRYYNFIKTMLADGEFDYANKPKGILPFHQYDDFIATPVYEHLKEAVAYSCSQNQAHVHFTISEEHLDGFLDAIKEVKTTIEEQSGVAIDITFSYQHKQTDTLAVDLNNAPFRENGKLLFRPGGHGALIENLNRLDADIVFIKNIDNVSHNNIKTIALYKKALGGMLMELQEKIFGYLTKIEQKDLDYSGIAEIFRFAKEKLSIDIPQDVVKYTPEHKLEFVRQLLNRPIRICGMVKNEGEPGGGPFWIKGDKGMMTLQIIESSQIDLDNKVQHDILSRSTHFNPVDVVCSLKNYKGETFDLNEFVDPSTGFIVYKNKNGKDLKSYELPGLWNGAMAGWITVFVEEPLETFNPVKTINDLLKPAHQPQ
jgi:hypothetical protein